MPFDETYYELLGVAPAASTDEVSAAFRTLGRKLHPDNQATGDAERFSAITLAYQTLKNEALRKKYDARLKMLRLPCADCEGTGRVWFQKGFTARISKHCQTCGGSGKKVKKASKNEVVVL
jgi:DnaJ-class molecular chaperone